MQKFKDEYGWNLIQFDDIKNYLADKKSTQDILQYNKVINSIRICDPAVGSGHFLVSALNEIIAIKSELGILVDSFKITNFDDQYVNWIDDMPLKATDTLIQSSYIFMSSMPEQICTIKKHSGDSVPIKFNFSITVKRINVPKTITMSVCADSLTSIQILRILKSGSLAKPKR
ncbi:MAG: hypothetical protein ACXVNO_00090 [Bacteroidia bacterium]